MNIARKGPLSSHEQLDGLTFPTLLETQDGKQITLEVCNEEDLTELTQFEKEFFDTGKPYAIEQFQEKFRIGDILLCKEPTSGALIGYVAVTYGPESHSQLEFKETDAYIAGVVVHKDHRGQGVARELNKVAQEIAEAKECNRIFACARFGKPGFYSLHSAKTGFEINHAATEFLEADEGDEGHRVILMKEITPLSERLKIREIEAKNRVPNIIIKNIQDETLLKVKKLIKAPTRLIIEGDPDSPERTLVTITTLLERTAIEVLGAINGDKEKTQILPSGDLLVICKEPIEEPAVPTPSKDGLLAVA